MQSGASKVVGILAFFGGIFSPSPSTHFIPFFPSFFLREMLQSRVRYSIFAFLSFFLLFPILFGKGHFSSSFRPSQASGNSSLFSAFFFLLFSPFSFLPYLPLLPSSCSLGPPLAAHGASRLPPWGSSCLPGPPKVTPQGTSSTQKGPQVL